MADEKEQTLDFREVGSSGLKRFSGFIYEEFLKNLTGQKGVSVYKEMSSNDATVGAILFTIEMLCRGVKWRVESASINPEDEAAAQFLTECMDDMSHTWNDFITEALSMLPYGHSFHEIIYKRRAGKSDDPSYRSKYNDGRIGWRKIPMRSQDTIYRWLFDDHGGIQGIEQVAPPTYKTTIIPIEKALLFRTTANKNNPEGRSILRSAYRAWYMKKNIENIEGIGIERDLAGLPVALVPPEILSAGATTNQRALLQSLKEIVTNIRRDEQEGVIFPQAFDANGKQLYELKLLSTGGSRQFDTDKIVTRYDQRIAMCALADFMFLGQKAVGSFALADSKTNLFSIAIGAFMDIISDVLNRYAVPRLFALNPDIPFSKLPQFKHGDIESVDLDKIGAYIQTLVGAGMPIFPNPDLEKHLMELGGLPPLVDPRIEASVYSVPTMPEQPDKINVFSDPPPPEAPVDPNKPKV